jgi:primary-amine oxidase
MIKRRLLAVPATLLLVLGGVVAAAPEATAAETPACTTGYQVTESLPSGTTWQLCWSIQFLSGLQLSNVAISSARYPEPVQVLQSITLAQLNVPYDSGETEYNDITDYGFDFENLLTLTPADCPGGELRAGSDAGDDPTPRNVLCVSKEPADMEYHLADEKAPAQPYTATAWDLVLRTISKVGWYEYVTEYRLHDNGQITSRLGATGDLSPHDYVDGEDEGWPIGKGGTDFAGSHYHSAFWRVDFNIAGAGHETVQQFDTKSAGAGVNAAKLATSSRQITREGTFTKANQRWWRVVSPTLNADGHNRSYELGNTISDVYLAHPETRPDVTFTQNDPCEKFATGNVDPECPGDESILDYVKDHQKMTDPVMWVRVGFHHTPRDEDQSPMPLHWQGFDLTPRDFTEISRLAPDALTSVNGNPSPSPTA